MAAITQTLLAFAILLAFISIIYLVTIARAHYKETFEEKPDAKILSYVINLTKNTDRMDHFRKNYASTDLAAQFPYQRFEAINGREIDVSKYVTPSVMQGIQFIESTGRRTSLNQLTKGMVGCYLSHLAVYRDALENGADYALIFEDDALIAPDVYGAAISKLVGATKDPLVPKQWDIMLLGYICLDCHEINADYNIVADFYGLHGYLISRSGMEKLKGLLPINNQIDLEMSRLAQAGKLNIYSLTKHKVTTGPFGTDLQMFVS